MNTEVQRHDDGVIPFPIQSNQPHEVNVQICDAMMGAGKTSAAINMMNSEPGPFIYITPYISEYERILRDCSKAKFQTPSPVPSKLKNLLGLLRDGRNIASTHALFSSYTAEVVDLIRSGHYTLIMDETFEVIQQMNVSKSDIDELFRNNYIRVDEETGLVEWLDDGYIGSTFQDVMWRAKSGTLILCDGVFMFWMFPIEVFKAFDRAIIMTYLFNCQNQRYYFDIYDIPYQYIGVRRENGKLVFCGVDEEDDVHQDLRDLITVVDGKRLNEIGTPAGCEPNSEEYRNSTLLSHNHLMKERRRIRSRKIRGSMAWTGSVFDKAGKNIYNVFHNQFGLKKAECMWSILEEYKMLIDAKRYSSEFVVCTMRATNEYRDRRGLAYIRNIYINPFLKKFFKARGCQVDEDAYALSELLQWVWRSAIRDHKPIVLYLPSSRMRYLFTKWLDDVNNGVEVRKRNPTERITETVNEQPT